MKLDFSTILNVLIALFVFKLIDKYLLTNIFGGSYEAEAE